MKNKKETCIPLIIKVLYKNDFTENGKRHVRKTRTGLILILLLAFSLVSGYALATILTSMPTQSIKQTKPILGNFTMALVVNNIQDLYAWQVVITFNPSELKVIDVSPGGFIGSDFPFFVKATDIGEGLILLGGSLYGNTAGKTGGGRLANIVFGYITPTYAKPMLVQKAKFYETKMLNSNGSKIPFKLTETINNQTYLFLTFYEN
jgi:hypothetical protein